MLHENVEDQLEYEREESRISVIQEL